MKDNYQVFLTFDEREQLISLCMDKALDNLTRHRELVRAGFPDEYYKNEYEFFNSLYHKLCE